MPRVRAGPGAPGLSDGRGRGAGAGPRPRVGENFFKPGGRAARTRRLSVGLGSGHKRSRGDPACPPVGARVRPLARPGRPAPSIRRAGLPRRVAPPSLLAACCCLFGAGRDTGPPLIRPAAAGPIVPSPATPSGPGLAATADRPALPEPGPVAARAPRVLCRAISGPVVKRLSVFQVSVPAGPTRPLNGCSLEPRPSGTTSSGRSFASFRVSLRRPIRS